jgi:hypothetical protein
LHLNFSYLRSGASAQTYADKNISKLRQMHKLQ